MIVTELYDGQGLGNQLWCYVVARVIATDKGYDFGIKSPEKFKGKNFISLDFGKKVVGGTGPEGGPPSSLPQSITQYYVERKLVHPKNGVDVRVHDKHLVNISDNTKVDGIMQDELYIEHRRDEIRQWLKVDQRFDCYDYSNKNICILNFRGEEYVHIKNVFLPKTYWHNAMKHMLKKNKKMQFVVITDDVNTAKIFFPELSVFHFNIAKDYSIIKNAQYLILSNSSFAWFPAWLSTKLKFCIAPKYWSQYNCSDGYWGCSYNITKGWFYLNRNGRLENYETCLKQLNRYLKKNLKNYLVSSSLQPKRVFSPMSFFKKILTNNMS